MIPSGIRIRSAVVLFDAVEVAATGCSIRDELVCQRFLDGAADIRGQGMGIAVHQGLGHTGSGAGLVVGGAGAGLVLQHALLADVVLVASLRIVEVHAVLHDAAVLEAVGGARRLVLAGAHLGGGIEVGFRGTFAVLGRLLVRAVVVAVAGLGIGHELLLHSLAGHRTAGVVGQGFHTLAGVFVEEWRGARAGAVVAHEIDAGN